MTRETDTAIGEIYGGRQMSRIVILAGSPRKYGNTPPGTWKITKCRR